MPRGQKDFGMYAATEVVASVSDMGEVAARLGSIMVYDRRGLVVDFDNFEAPVLRWVALAPHALAYVRLDSEEVRSLAQAVKFHTPAVIGSHAYIYKATAVPASKRLGFEISFCKLSASCYLYGWFRYGDEIGLGDAMIKIDPDKEVIEIDVRDEGYVEVVPTKLWSFADFCFNTVKLVADFNTKKYVRLLFNLHEYDISQYSLPFTAGAQREQISHTLRFENITGVVGEGWVDDFIFTQDEP